MKNSKKILLGFLIIVTLLIILSACEEKKSADPVNVPSGTTGANDTATPTEIPGNPSLNRLPAELDDISIEAQAFIDPFMHESVAIINVVRRDDFSAVTFPYEQVLAYDSLSGEDKIMYDEMLKNAREFTPFAYTAEEDGYEVMNRAYDVLGAIYEDHPEIQNYFILYEVNEDIDGDIMTVALEACYFMPGGESNEIPADIDELRHVTEVFEAVCDRIIKRMPEGLSAYDKYRYLATVISLVTEYDHDSVGGWQDGTAYGSIMGGHSICAGFSKGFLYLCKKADLWCELTEGVVGDTSHGWNLVKLESGTYHVDVTWSDGYGYPDSIGWESYFMLTQEEIQVSHTITDRKVATGEKIIYTYSE